VSAAVQRPLGDRKRRLLLLVELHVRRHGLPPSWGALAAASGMPRRHLATMLDGLRRDGLVSYTSAPLSVRVTRQGVRAALGGDR
jgi:DNA-binding IclR family transcriptional regulator